MKEKLKATAAALGIGILILDSSTAAEGMKDGIQLCLQTVIPSLFPFLVLCGILTATAGSWKIAPLENLCRICKLPANTSHLLLTGLLGGYPIGARSVSQAYTAGQLTKQQTQRMLPLCNNCGPAFLFGIVSRAFSDAWSCWALWGILISSVILTAQLMPASGGPEADPSSSTGTVTFVQAVENALHTMVRICGWVILFKMLISFLDHWILWSIPLTWRIGIVGCLELSNGCVALPWISNEEIRFILCAGMLAFGGLSVTMQTCSVIAPDLDRSQYLQGKVIQCAISLLLAWIVQTVLRSPSQAAIILAISASAWIVIKLSKKKVRNGSRFSRKIHV